MTLPPQNERPTLDEARRDLRADLEVATRQAGAGTGWIRRAEEAWPAAIRRALWAEWECERLRRELEGQR